MLKRIDDIDPKALRETVDNFKNKIARLIRVFNVQLNLSGWS